MFTQTPTELIYTYDHETLLICPWGPNALRVRATKCATMPTEDWALDEPAPPTPQPQITIDPANSQATITNGTARATISRGGKLTVHNAATGALLLEEYHRTRTDVRDPKASALEVEARELRPIAGGDYALTMRLESVSRSERLYGMGQYQQPYLDLKGCDLELAQRNSQASVPFLLSSLGYGLLWNNPSVGRAVLGTNIMSFSASSTTKLDYWLGIVEAYCAVTGRPPMMPEYGLGFWQSKLRYQTQDELLAVAREYKRRNLPLDVLVIDFFHWRAQGEWSFDKAYWPDPQAMVDELRSLGVEPMVSIWPTVEPASENWNEMLERGLLIRNERGYRAVMDFQGNTVHFDATNPEARTYVWAKAARNYGQYGIRLFWLDEAEPEYKTYDFDNWRYHLGPSLAVGNVYPRHYSQAFYEGALAQDGSGRFRGQDPNAVNLVRCAWAGSQKYGALVWSGDIASSWGSLRNQVAAGLNMGIAGISHWTTDIGGFHGGNPDDPGFRELLVRWFQWGTFLPVMRLHGDRYPQKAPLGNSGGGKCPSGVDNEVWSYGEEVGAVLERYLRLRESMRAYVRGLMEEASEKGTPVIRTLFLEFPEDERAWEVEDEYMFGERYLVAPVLYAGLMKRTVYFPKGAKWKEMEGEKTFEGGTSAEVDAPLEKMPVFERA
ncbi:family 31 glycoside hydrolase [Cryphonectria parasitica EP155]|uniref:Family 31 glycoside hydrolase n=1 Tax=Cryphonectria parasitica (strain ATCC 38755 / EP155) TaxID=660469 RepID=A0A9P5CQ91_CRYP1|nr:family 31 glycoside hydrolase [Cryphonectria parasitica EP155]KAF3766202.1 family 31 glycoside hydrolase [Cryphonectria parasitica EP155]